MVRLAVAVLVLCGGCRFRVGAVPATGGGDDLAMPDVDLGSDDAALGGSDDLPAVVVDMATDPCANPPALGSGNVAAQCVIGAPPLIDGNLADWPTSLFQPMTHSTPGVTTTTGAGSWTGVQATDDADLSARWAVRWDLSNVYVAVSIVDDIRQTPNTTAITQNDCLELFFDGDHDRTTTYGADDWQLAYSADGKTGVYQNGNTASLPGGATVVKAYGGTSPNWTLEVAVPWSILGSAAPALGRVIGFDLKLDDNDTGLSTRDRDLIMYYVPGVGDGSCRAPYCRTDAFGAVQLQGR